MLSSNVDHAIGGSRGVDKVDSHPAYFESNLFCNEINNSVALTPPNFVKLANASFN